MKGKIIGHTFVQDYVFWPVECNQTSLYDWIRLSEMKKLPNKIELNCDNGDLNGAESDNEKDIDSTDNKVMELPTPDLSRKQTAQ